MMSYLLVLVVKKKKKKNRAEGKCVALFSESLGS